MADLIEYFKKPTKDFVLALKFYLYFYVSGKFIFQNQKIEKFDTMANWLSFLLEKENMWLICLAIFKVVIINSALNMTYARLDDLIFKIVNKYFVNNGKISLLFIYDKKKREIFLNFINKIEKLNSISSDFFIIIIFLAFIFFDKIFIFFIFLLVLISVRFCIWSSFEIEKYIRENYNPETDDWTTFTDEERKSRIVNIKL